LAKETLLKNKKTPALQKKINRIDFIIEELSTEVFEKNQYFTC